MEKIKSQIYKYNIILEPAKEGGFTVFVPSLTGCITEGDSFEEAVNNAKEAIELYLESLAEHHENIPIEDEAQVMTEVEVQFKRSQIKNSAYALV